MVESRKTKPFLSIVIPAYNEERNIRKGVLGEVENYLRGVDYKYEVLVVDDGSTDETLALVKKWIDGKKNWRLIKNPHGGKALTVMAGLLASTGDIALFTDMDQATPLDQVEKFFPYFEKGFSAKGVSHRPTSLWLGPAFGWDVVIGSRSGRQGAPFLRRLAAWGFAALRNLILGLPFSDTQCGFKAFNKKSRAAIFPEMQKRWESMRATGAAVHAGFDVETLFIAKKMDFKIAEVPVNWHYVGTERVQLINDSLDAIRDMLRIRINDLMGRY